MTDVKNLLEELAGHGAGVELAEHDLLPRIRRRRRVRAGLVGASGVAAVAVLAVGAYAAMPGNATTPAGPASTVASTARPTAVAPYQCGDVFPAPDPTGSGRQVATVTLTQKSISRTAGGWSGSIRSKYQYHGGLPHPLIAGLPPQWVAVVRDGRMVGHATVSTTAKAVELRAGQSKVVDAGIAIRSCAGASLPAGSYLLYEDLSPTAKPSKSLVAAGPIGRLQLP
ncbi:MULTISPECIES: hypothetical protein [Kribbella]|uniref:Uncharacterized protein n=1 Tax=Kribbella karoonensis TaxID=324851 RepID=A0ABN2DDX0_9ACTN|nr:hypothetical protein [Kribbella sp.]HZX05852.1 hypothetical protein [Kribbella sp.]